MNIMAWKDDGMIVERAVSAWDKRKIAAKYEVIHPPHLVELSKKLRRGKVKK